MPEDTQSNPSQEARSILKELTSKIPEFLVGIDRHMFVGNLISNLEDNQRSLLRKYFDSFLMKMKTANASDIDLGGHGAMGMIWYRIFGSKKPDVEWGTYTSDETSLLLQNILSDRQRQFLYDKRNLDFSYTVIQDGKSFRFRADMYFDLDDVALNMRAINDLIRPIETLGFHPNIINTLSLLHVKDGLTLVTGITGSGKSTTLDSIIDMNNHTVNGEIIIIGSPIEYVHKSDKCIVRHREVGKDTLSFKEGTIEALRQDPDIVVIGEMRDPETIMTALEVTDSGHRVYSTLHTASAVESIDRIIGEVPPEEQERVRLRLADVLQCVISQKLVPSLDGRRVMAKEVLLATPSVRAAIKNKNTSEIYQMISESGNLGMITMEQDLKQLFMQKRISRATALNYANNKRRMEQLLSLGTVSN